MSGGVPAEWLNRACEANGDGYPRCAECDCEMLWMDEEDYDYTCEACREACRKALNEE